MSNSRYGNITTPVGVAAAAAHVAINAAHLVLLAQGLLLAGRRRKRSTASSSASFSSSSSQDLPSQDQDFVKQVLFKVLTDVDDPGCSALALCHATSLPPAARSSNHSAIITMLSPHPGTPVAWGALDTPAAKYQYAAFIGLWAGLTEDRNQCRHVFPTCPLSAEDVIDALANQQVPCGGANNNIEA